jgi:hypothetical protein
MGCRPQVVSPARRRDVPGEASPLVDCVVPNALDGRSTHHRLRIDLGIPAQGRAPPRPVHRGHRHPVPSPSAVTRARSAPGISEASRRCGHVDGAPEP